MTIGSGGIPIPRKLFFRSLFLTTTAFTHAIRLSTLEYFPLIFSAQLWKRWETQVT